MPPYFYLALPVYNVHNALLVTELIISMPTLLENLIFLNRILPLSENKDLKKWGEVGHFWGEVGHTYIGLGFL